MIGLIEFLFFIIFVLSIISAVMGAFGYSMGELQTETVKRLLTRKKFLHWILQPFAFGAWVIMYLKNKIDWEI